MTWFPKPPPVGDRTRSKEAGVGTAVGLLVAALSAAAVVAAGVQYLPSPGDDPASAANARAPGPPVAPAATPPPAVAPAVPPAAPPVPAPAAPAIADVAVPAAKTAVAEAPAEPPETPKPADPKPVDKDLQAAKDAAYESWRANKPGISTTGNTSTIVIPMKGTTAGGTWSYRPGPRAVVITLPRAASLNTMHFYKLRHEGFQTLWVDQAEVDAKPTDGTRLRLVVAVHTQPQVELGDGYVRITIPRPPPAAND